MHHQIYEQNIVYELMFIHECSLFALATQKGWVDKLFGREADTAISQSYVHMDLWLWMAAVNFRLVEKACCTGFV